MSQRIKIPGFVNDVLINGDEIMYAELSGEKKAPVVSIYFNNTDAIVNTGEKAIEFPNGLIALNIYLTPFKDEDVYPRAQRLLQGINNALIDFGGGLVSVPHNYGDINQVVWQSNDVTPK